MHLRATVGAAAPTIPSHSQSVLNEALSALQADHAELWRRVASRWERIARQGSNTGAPDGLPDFKSEALQHLVDRALEEPGAWAAALQAWPGELGEWASQAGFRHGLVAPLWSLQGMVGALVVLRAQGLPFGIDQQLVVERFCAYLGQLLTLPLDESRADLPESEGLGSITDLVRALAHEIRNPLGVIANSVAALRRLRPLEPLEVELLEMVEEECSRLNATIHHLLDFVTPRPVIRVPVQLAESIAGALVPTEAARRSAGVDVRLDLTAAPSHAHLDEQMLHQALSHLFLNAVQAMPQGGVLTVSVRRELADGQQMLCIDVTDTGAGLSAGVSERMFQPFFTTKASGIGLGLALVRQVADAHGGAVHVAPNSGSGTRISLRLPLQAPEPGP